MPALNRFHDAVKNALVKDGWTITHDPFLIRYDDVDLFADLAADRPLGAERQGQQIVVEIKSFLHPSPMYDLEQAIGQYSVYRSLLEVTDPDRKLYLATSHLVRESLFHRPAVQLIVQRTDVSLLFVNMESEEVVEWTS